MSLDELERPARDVTEELVSRSRPDAPARTREPPPGKTVAWYRRPLRLLAVLVFTAAVIAGGLRWWLEARQWETTDDAFIDTHMVMVAPQVAGRIARVLVDDNQKVAVGQLLVEIDPAVFQAQLDQAEANLARDQAHLENGQLNLGRYVPLAKQGFAPEQQVATQQAIIAQEQATIKADHAAIEYAKTQLSYTKLMAPFGRRNTSARCRQIIHSSTTRGSPSETNALVVINQVQPIAVMFTLAAADIPQAQDALTKGSVKAIALSADGKTELDSGTLAAIDNQANTTSGTISLKAIFPNPERRL